MLRGSAYIACVDHRELCCPASHLVTPSCVPLLSLITALQWQPTAVAPPPAVATAPPSESLRQDWASEVNWDATDEFGFPVVHGSSTATAAAASTVGLGSAAMVFGGGATATSVSMPVATAVRPPGYPSELNPFAAVPTHSRGSSDVPTVVVGTALQPIDPTQWQVSSTRTGARCAMGPKSILVVGPGGDPPGVSTSVACIAALQFTGNPAVAIGAATRSQLQDDNLLMSDDMEGEGDMGFIAIKSRNTVGGPEQQMDLSKRRALLLLGIISQTAYLAVYLPGRPGLDGDSEALVCLSSMRAAMLATGDDPLCIAACGFSSTGIQLTVPLASELMQFQRACARPAYERTVPSRLRMALELFAAEDATAGPSPVARTLTPTAPPASSQSTPTALSNGQSRRGSFSADTVDLGMVEPGQRGMAWNTHQTSETQESDALSAAAPQEGSTVAGSDDGSLLGSLSELWTAQSGTTASTSVAAATQRMPTPISSGPASRPVSAGLPTVARGHSHSSVTSASISHFGLPSGSASAAATRSASVSSIPARLQAQADGPLAGEDSPELQFHAPSQVALPEAEAPGPAEFVSSLNTPQVAAVVANHRRQQQDSAEPTTTSPAATAASAGSSTPVGHASPASTTPASENTEPLEQALQASPAVAVQDSWGRLLGLVQAVGPRDFGRVLSKMQESEITCVKDVCMARNDAELAQLAGLGLLKARRLLLYCKQAVLNDAQPIAAPETLPN